MTKTIGKIQYLLIITALLIYSALLFFNAQDSDMFFTISSGRDILNGNFHTNSLTNLPIIIQQWLYAVILAKLDIFGVAGDLVFVFIQDMILWIISYKFIYSKTQNRFKSIICPIICTIICFNYMINIRPQIITMIFIMLEIIVVDKYISSKKSSILLWLIPISILSANMHQAIFLYHLFVLIPYLVSDHKIQWKVIVMIPILLLCSLCTPYGINGPLYIVKTFKSDIFTKILITEVGGLEFASLSGIIMIIVLIVIIYANYYNKSNKYINFYGISIFILTISSIRHISILYIVLVFMSIYLVSNDIKIDKLYLIVFSFFSILMLIVSITNFKDNRKSNSATLLDDLNIPTTAKIFNTLNIGSYLEYNGYTVTIDARPELYTKEFIGNSDIIDNYRKVEYGIYDENYISYDKIFDVLDDYEYVILRTTSFSNTALNESSDYTEIKTTDDYRVWKHNN